MKNQNSKREDADRLRQKAEEKFTLQKSQTNKPLSEADQLKLIHELEVHQIELKMQNEELALAKEKAELSEEKYTDLYDFAPSGYLTISKEGEISDINFAAAFMLGKERSTLVKKRFANYISPETRPAFNHFVQEIFTSKTKQSCEAIILKQTNPALAQQEAVPIYVNIDGIICKDYVLCQLTIVDISQRKQAEQFLIESETNLHFLNTMVNEAFNLKDLESIYHYISSKLSEILPNTLILFNSIDSENEEFCLENYYGIDKEQAKQLLTIMSFNPIGKKFKLSPDFKELLKTGKLVEFEKGLPEFFKNELSSFSADSIEKIVGIDKIYSIGISKEDNLFANFHFFTFNKKEITNSVFIEAYVKQTGLILQIKQAELKLREANATKDRFISILAHDLRSPFNSLLGFSDLIITNIDKYDKKKIKIYVEAINKTANQTYNLLNTLLEWSRSQRDKIPFNPQTTDLYYLIYDTFVLMNDLAKVKQITIELKVAEVIDAKVDSEMIKTVMRNLLSNAIKFTPEQGAIRILVSKKRECVQIEIADTGIGMPPKTIDSLFRIGKIESKRGTNDERGTGFGLLLCKEFIDKHKGKIWVESELGKGSKFVFTLPR